MKKIYLFLAFFIVLQSVKSQTPTLYKDINSLINQSSISGNPEYTTVGNKVFFVATAPLTGKELYVSDGTTGGTIVIDINPGIPSSSPAGLTEMNGMLYFSATDGSNVTGTELWRTDGTVAGTMMVKDIYTGQGNSSYPTQLTKVGGVLYFVATTGVGGITGKELFVSDGTDAGTNLVKDIRVGSSGSNPRNLLGIGSTLFFVANDGVNGEEVWKSNGTEAGTVIVKDINAGSAGASPNYLTNLNGTLYFSATKAASATELWKSDGTDAGTVVVKEATSGIYYPAYLYAFGGNVYFQARDDGTYGTVLWKTDGTLAGTVIVKNNVTPYTFYTVGSILYFTGTDYTTGIELWRTDGSAGGTVLVKDLNPGSNGSNPTNLTAFNGNLYFYTVGEYALWKSDGTGSGTVKLADATVGGGGITYTYGGPTKLFFTLNKYKEGIPATATGAEPWVSDGTDGGTNLLKDINTNTDNSNPNNFCNVGNNTFFTANNGVVGNELWKTDGTAAGTVLVKDIRTGTLNSDPAFLTNVGGTLFFAAYTDNAGWELWKSDGTEAGTVMVKDINPGTQGSNPYTFSSINGTLYFSAYHPSSGWEMWKSDGTDIGTQLIKDINPGVTNSYPVKFTEVNGTIFFTAQNGAAGANNDEELWKTDGTAAGTVLVKDIRSGVAASAPTGLTSFNNKLYFSADDGVNGQEMWVSDGTDAGTVLFKEFTAGVSHGNPKNYKVIGNTMYFTARGTAGAASVWKTDGTAGGTVKVKQTSSTSGSGPEPNEFTLSNGSIFFTAYADGAGKELWKTDGTDAGTVVVKDIMPGTISSDVEFLTDFKGTLYFKADGNLNNDELWKSDGTEAGTVSLELNAYGESKPSELIVLNDRLLFGATDFFKGAEMWRIENFAVPLTLLNFTAQKENKKVALNWQTSNEINTALFQIERAENNRFVKIGETNAENNLNGHTYKFIDEYPLPGNNFYRLKMIDFDGSFTYSSVERIYFDEKSYIRIFPNPALNKLNIFKVKDFNNLQVIDAAGKVVWQQKISNENVQINIQRLLPGNYILKLQGTTQVKSLQFLKQ